MIRVDINVTRYCIGIRTCDYLAHVLEDYEPKELWAFPELLERLGGDLAVHYWVVYQARANELNAHDIVEDNRSVRFCSLEEYNYQVMKMRMVPVGELLKVQNALRCQNGLSQLDSPVVPELEEISSKELRTKAWIRGVLDRRQKRKAEKAHLRRSCADKLKTSAPPLVSCSLLVDEGRVVVVLRVRGSKPKDPVVLYQHRTQPIPQWVKYSLRPGPPVIISPGPTPSPENSCPGHGCVGSPATVSTPSYTPPPSTRSNSPEKSGTVEYVPESPLR